MLGQLAALLRAERPDGDRIFGLCEDLHTRFKSLTTNAVLFMQKVNRLLASSAIDVRDFTLFKADTITYLNDFIADLDVFAARIRRRLDDLDQVDPSALTAAFAAGEAASGTLALDALPDSLTWAGQARRHLAGLAEWFREDSAARAGAGALYEKTRAAVLGIARSAERIREASSSPSSRSADLLDLAVRFEAASSDGEAHQLWHAAFGLSSARHLGIALDYATAVPSSASWWEPQAAVTISRQLRSGGRSDYVRRAKNVADRSAAKNDLAAIARAAQERADQAARTLTGLGTCSIGEVNDRADGPLDPSALRLPASLCTGLFGADGSEMAPDWPSASMAPCRSAWLTRCRPRRRCWKRRPAPGRFPTTGSAWSGEPTWLPLSARQPISRLPPLLPCPPKITGRPHGERDRAGNRDDAIEGDPDAPGPAAD